MLAEEQTKGAYRRFKEEPTKNPLDRTLGQAPKPREKKQTPNIVIEDMAIIEQRQQATKEQFTEGQQPTLDFMKFQKVELPTNSETLKSITITVEFNGTSVLEGYRELVAHGLAKTPLPDCIKNARESAKNTFICTA